MVGGLSSAGRAPALQAGGHRFDPDRLHHFASLAGGSRQRFSRYEDTSFRPRTDFGRVSALPIGTLRSEEHTSELQSLMRISYAVFCLKKKKHDTNTPHYNSTVNKYKKKTH